MKTLLILSILLLYLPHVASQEVISPPVRYYNGSAVVDVAAACKDKTNCTINILGKTVRIVSEKVTSTYPTVWSVPSGGWAGETDLRVSLPLCPKVESEIPISGIRMNTYGSRKPMSFDPQNSVLSNFTVSDSQDFMFAQPVQQFAFSGCNSSNQAIAIVSIMFGSSVNHLFSHLNSSGRVLESIYSESLENIKRFTLNIGKSDRPHLERFKSALETAIQAFGLSGGEPTVPVTHEDVREAARMVVAMGVVLEEIFTEYDDVPATRQVIENIRELVSQLRQSFGWKDGLAGSPSKSLAAIGTVLETVLRETASIKDSSSQNPEKVIYNQLKFKAMALKGAVRGRSGGDAAVGQEVTDLAKLWNSPQWQNELYSLINAGKDENNLIQLKVKLLLMAVNSLEDLTGVKFDQGERFLPLVPPSPPPPAPVQKKG